MGFFHAMKGVMGGAPAAPTPTLGSLSDPHTATVIGSGAERPIVSFRFTVGGAIQEASGDTGVALSYNNVGNWLDDIVGLDSSDWEVRMTINSEDTGDPGTWSGDTPAVFRVLSTQRTYTWTKDANDLGTANSVLTITLRQVSDTGNSAARSNMDYDAVITI